MATITKWTGRSFMQHLLGDYASEDDFAFTESELLDSGILAGNVVTLDVLLNDEEGASLHALTSIHKQDAATGASLIEADPEAVWEALVDARGNTVAAMRITEEGQVELDLSASLQRYGVSSVGELQDGQVIQIAFAYAVAFDGSGKPLDWTTVQFTLVGESNQSASITGYTAPDPVFEDQLSPAAVGLLTVVDPDDGEASFQDPTAQDLYGLYGSFTFAPGDSAATWEWTYTPDARAQALAHGQEVTESLTVYSFDGTASQVIRVTVVGTNDGPVVTAEEVTGAATEPDSPTGELTDSGTIAFSDLDLADAHTVSEVTAGRGALGTLTASLTQANGGSGTGGEVTWTYRVGALAVEHLSAGQSHVETFSFSILDGYGGATECTVSVTLTGTNDEVMITSAASSGAVVEDGTAAATGTLGFADVDLADPHRVTSAPVSSTHATPMGALSAVEAAAGLVTWTYAIDNVAAQQLAQGQVVTEVHRITVDDQRGHAASQDVTITITGANDAPVVASAEPVALTEGGVGRGFNALAQASDVDAGATLSVTNVQPVPPGVMYDWLLREFIVFPDTPDFQHLATGATSTVTVHYEVSDGTEATPASLSWTITGTNDAPIAVSDTASGTHVETLVIDVLANDTDVDDGHVFTLVSARAPSGMGSASVLDNKLVFDPGHDFDHLNPGETATVTIDYVMKDEGEASSSSTLTIAVTGNTPAEIFGDVGVGMEEDGRTSISGLSLTVVDPDPSQARFQTPASLQGRYGVFSFDPATGTWGYQLHNDSAEVQALPALAREADTLTVTSWDGTDSITIWAEVIGANDAPAAGKTEPAQAEEDHTAVAVGALAAITDVDAGATLVVGRMDSPLPRGVSYDTATQIFTLDPSDAAYQRLAAGETTPVTVNYEVSDGLASTQASVSWVVTGTNDAPVITSSAPAGSVMEDAQLPATGTVSASDVDSGATATYSGNATGTYGSFTVDAQTGAWAYVLDDAAHQDLAADEVHTETFTVTVTDDQWATATQDVVITVAGANDSPRAGQITSDATEDGEAALLFPLANAFDIDHGATLSVERVQPMLPPGVSYNPATQTFELDPSDAAYQGLADGERTEVTVRYEISDGTLSTSTSATWTVTGINDVPVIGGESTAALTEDASSTPDLATGGVLTLIDPDAGQSSFTAQAGTTGSNGYGTFTLDAAGHWTYTASNAQAAIQQLGAGQSLTDSFTAVSSDGSNAQLVTVTLHGTNDSPVATSERQAAAVIEDSQQTATGTVRFDDGDLADRHLVSSAPRMSTHELPLGTFTAVLDTTAGQVSWTYTVDNEAAQAMAQDQVVTEVHRITISDANGGTATQDVTITITGTHDAPRVAAIIRPVGEDQGIQVLDALGGSQDREWGNTLGVVGPQAPLPEGVSYDAASHGFTLDLSLPVYQALAEGETRDVTVSYGVSDGTETVPGSATWTVTGTNDRPLVWGSNHARVSASSGPAVGGQLFIQDADAGQSSWQLVKPEGLYGTLSFDPATGQWQYARHALPPGLQDTDVFHLRSADGTLVPIFIEISVPPADAAPLAWSEGNLGGRVFEDTPTGTDALGKPVTAIAGVLLDPTGGAAGQLQLAEGASLTGPYGTFSFDSDTARWTFTLDNGSIEVQQLSDGSTRFQELALALADGSPAQILRVEIAGTNDRALLVAEEGGMGGSLVLGSGMDLFSGPMQLSGLLYVRDIDEGQGGFDRSLADEDGLYRVDGDYGSFLFDVGTGAWRYELDQDPFPLWQLGAGEFGTDSMTVWSADRSASATITARIEGQDDPTLFFGEVSGAAIEDESTKVGGLTQAGDLDTGTRYLVTLLAGDGAADWDESLQSYVQAGQYGTLRFQPNGGAIQYLLANDSDAVQSLRGSEVVHDVFRLQASDGTVQEIAVSVTGSNDAAVIVGTVPDLVVTTDPGTHTTAGVLTLTDSDAGEDRFVPLDDLRGHYGQFGFDAATGAWTYTLDLSRVPARSADDPALQDTLTVTTADGTTAQVTVGITGSREARTIGGTATGSLAEDGTASFVEDALRLDEPPSGQAPFQAPDPAALVTDHGSFSFDPMTGHWRFDLDNAAEAVQSLGAGDTVTETLTVHSWDGSASQAITVTITGTNDAAFISGHTTGQVQHQDQAGGLPFTSGLLTVQDRDAGESLLDSDGVFQGRYGTLTVDADTGHWLYSLAGTLAFQALAPGAPDNDVFTLYSVDQTPVQVTITATGFDEPAVITGATTTVVSGTSGLPATGSVFIDDPDPGQSAFKPLDAPQGQYGYLTFTPETGDWSYAVDPARLPAAGEDLIVRDAFQVHSLDGQSFDFIRFEIQVPAGFVPPVAVDIDAQVNASSPWQVLRGSIEHAAHFTLPASVDGLYGQFSFDADRGTWAYALDAGLSSELALQDRLSLTAANGSTLDLAISIPGRHAGTLITGRDTFHITELTTEATTPAFLRARGTLLALDLRTGAQVAFVESTAGPEGGFGIDAQGNWSYEIATVDTVRGQVQFAAQTLTGEVHLVTVTLDEMTLDALGTEGHEALIGDPARAETVLAGAGSDYVVGLYTASSGLRGEAGNDLLAAGARVDESGTWAGDNVLDGGDGDDALFGVASGLQAFGTTMLLGGAGKDTLVGGEGLTVGSGGLGDDVLTAGAGAATLFGGEGHDLLVAGTGGGRLVGGDGDDTLYTTLALPGSPMALLYGGSGQNRFVLGDGQDRVIFDASGSSNRIENFNAAANEDLLGLTSAAFPDLSGPLDATWWQEVSSWQEIVLPTEQDHARFVLVDSGADTVELVLAQSSGLQLLAEFSNLSGTLGYEDIVLGAPPAPLPPTAS